MTPIPAGWKPIESAPKDGTPVLLFARHIDAEASTRVVGWFNADYGWIAQSYIGQPFARLIPSQWAELLPFPGNPASVAPGDAQDEQPKRNGCGSVSFKLSDGSAVSCDWSAHEWELSIPATRHERDIAFKELLQEIGRLRASVAAPAAGDALDAARYRTVRRSIADAENGANQVAAASDAIGLTRGSYPTPEQFDAIVDHIAAQQGKGGEA